MSERVTHEEQAQLDAIQARMDALTSEINARPRPAAGDVIVRDIVRDMEAMSIFRMSPELVDKAALFAANFLTRSTPEERRRIDAMTAEWNAVMAVAKARRVAREDKAAAAKERAAVRTAMCRECFTVHAGECA